METAFADGSVELTLKQKQSFYHDWFHRPEERRAQGDDSPRPAGHQPHGGQDRGGHA